MNERRQENATCRLLSTEENDQLSKHVGSRCKAISFAIVEVFYALPCNRNAWTEQFVGVAAFIKDYINRSYYIRVFDLEAGMLMEQELYRDFQYQKCLSYFHVFEARDYQVALNFASEAEAQLFWTAYTDWRDRPRKKNVEEPLVCESTPNLGTFSLTLNPRENTGSLKHNKGPLKLTKDAIGRPMDFRIVSHVSMDLEKGLKMVMSDDLTKSISQQAGIAKDFIGAPLPTPSIQIPSMSDGHAWPLLPQPQQSMPSQDPPSHSPHTPPPSQKGAGSGARLFIDIPLPPLPQPQLRPKLPKPPPPLLCGAATGPKLPSCRPPFPPPPPPPPVAEAVQVVAPQLTKVTEPATAAGNPADDRRPQVNACRPSIYPNLAEVLGSSQAGGAAEITSVGGGIAGTHQMDTANRQKQLQGVATTGRIRKCDDLYRVPTTSRPRHLRYESALSRRVTYVDWTREPSVSKLVEAGFFYEGPHDMVTCFCCGLNLRDWHPKDEPFVRHARWSGNCPFVLDAKGSDFVAAVEVAMMEYSESKENMHAVSAVMAAQSLPNERQQAGAEEMKQLSAMLVTVQTDAEACHSLTKLMAAADDLAEAERLRDRLACKVCMDNQVSVTFRPCGHLCVCQQCADSLSVCPICRCQLQEKHATFLP